MFAQGLSRWSYSWIATKQWGGSPSVYFSHLLSDLCVCMLNADGQNCLPFLTAYRCGLSSHILSIISLRRHIFIVANIQFTQNLPIEREANRTEHTYTHSVARRKTIPKGNKDAISLARMNRRSDDGSTYDFAKLQLHDFSAFSVHVDILLFLFFAPVVVCYFKMFYYDISCSEWEYQWAIFSCIPIQYYALIRCFVLFGLRNGLYVYCEKRPKYINYDAVNRMKDFGHIEK